MKREKPLRLITKESVALARGESVRRFNPYGFLSSRIVPSAEGVRFAYTSATLPGAVGHVVLAQTETLETPVQESDQESLPFESPEMLE